MDNHDFATQVMNAVARANAGQAAPQDYAMLRQALLSFPPSGSTFKQITQALENAPSMGPIPMETAPTTDTPDINMPTPVASLPWFEDGGGLSGGFDPRGQPTADFANAGPLDAFAGEGGNLATRNPLDFMADRFFGQDDSAPPSAPTPLPPSSPQPDIPGSTAAGGFPGFELDQTQYPGGGGQAAAGHGYGIPGGEADDFDPIGQMPEGVFSQGGNPFAVDIYSKNPDAYLLEYAKSKGGGPTAANMLVDPYNSAIKMAYTGMLGGGYGDSVFSGEGIGDATRLQMAEKFLDEYGQQGAFVNPDAIMEEMIRRGANTDYAQHTSPQTQMPYTREEIIQLTNNQIMTAAPFIGPEGEQYLTSVLQGASMEYINALATGEFTEEEMSYPKYLQMMGLDELLS